MKPTVDLTEDRMFPDLNQKRGPNWLLNTKSEVEILSDQFTRQLTLIPWEMKGRIITCDADFYQQPDPLTGNPKDFRYREECQKADSFDYCDRCGQRIVTPWRWDRSLCEECNIALYTELHYKKVPWEERENNWATLNGEEIWLE